MKDSNGQTLYALSYTLNNTDGTNARGYKVGTLDECNADILEVIASRGPDGRIEQLTILPATPVSLMVAEAESLGWGTRSLDYATWKQQVNRECLKLAGVSTDDIGDSDFACSFEIGESPREAAIIALEEAGFPFDSDPREED